MTKTTKVIVFAAMMVLGAALVFAQQSNTDQATFGEFGTDVDNYLHTVNWKDVDLKGFFAFSRFGANLPQGRLDLGVAFKPSNLYMGFYYNGDVLGYGETSSTGRVLENRKRNPNATYGVLLGLGSGMGVKFTFKDNLLVTAPSPTDGEGDVWLGSLTPAIELGGKFGPISIIRLSMPIMYNRAELVSATTNSSTYITAPVDENGNLIADDYGLLDADGNYAEPDIYIKLGVGALTLENNLRFRIYGVPAYGTDAKNGSQVGVGFVTTTIYEEGDNSRVAYWDNRFFLEDVITPSFNVSGSSGVLAYSVTVGIPLTIGGASHALNYKVEGPGAVEIKDYWKQNDFHLEVAPSVSVGLKVQPLEMLSLQGGLAADLFSWRMETNSTTKVSQTDEMTDNGLGASPDGSSTKFDFYYPKLSVATGLTFEIKKTVALDLLFFKQIIPSAAGMIYRAVGDSVGSSGASVVLSVKL